MDSRFLGHPSFGHAETFQAPEIFSARISCGTVHRTTQGQRDGKKYMTILVDTKNK